jgi:hypothetical protein
MYYLVMLRKGDVVGLEYMLIWPPYDNQVRLARE